MIGVLAGRRIDGEDAGLQLFPRTLRSLVADRIDQAFRTNSIATLVCAAASGADLIALEVARRRGIAMKIVLPYCVAEYRRTSVVDRSPEDGELFDRLVEEAAARNELSVLGLHIADPKAFELTNRAIVDEAGTLGARDSKGAIAFAVWDGPCIGRTDYTADFVGAAAARDIALRSIPILHRR